MPDSVRCVFDSSHAFTCEVHLDSETSPGAAAAPEPSATAKATCGTAAQPREAAVAALVGAYSKSVVQPVDVPLISAGALLTCASSELSVPLAFAATSYFFGPVAGFKAGYDLGQCLAAERQKTGVEATEQKAIDACQADGGTVTGLIGQQLLCNMTGVAQ